MSKGMHYFPFNSPKSDGHKIKSRYDTVNPIIYCPKLKDDTIGQHTSIGVQCNNCKKHIH